MRSRILMTSAGVGLSLLTTMCVSVERDGNKSGADEKVGEISQTATTYYVGPSRTYTTLTAFLNATALVAGDVVNIDCATYNDNVTISSSDAGSAGNPVKFVGLSGAGCTRP